MPTTAHTTAVLEKAGRRAAAWLGMSDDLAARLLDSEPGNLAGFAPTSQRWCSALALIDVAKRLERLCGSQEAVGIWLRGTHLSFKRPPIDVLSEANGLDLIWNYLSGFEL